jgi:hypothetical protein
LTGIEWTGTALADVDGLDKPVALRVKLAIERFATIGVGDVSPMQARS